MKWAYSFSNLCGVVYKCGNVAFTPDGTSLLSPVGNRVTVFDLNQHTSSTLPFENRKDIALVSVSPDGRMLLSIDVDGRALVVNYRRRQIVCRFNFKSRVRAAAFSPDGHYIAVTHGHHVKVWETPGLRRRVVFPFHLHRTYTGHYDDVVCISWSPDGRYFITGSLDHSARIYSLNPEEGFVPITLTGHRGEVVNCFFAKAPSFVDALHPNAAKGADEDPWAEPGAAGPVGNDKYAGQQRVYTVARDGAIFVWRWVPSPMENAATGSTGAKNGSGADADSGDDSSSISSSSSSGGGGGDGSGDDSDSDGSEEAGDGQKAEGRYFKDGRAHEPDDDMDGGNGPSVAGKEDDAYIRMGKGDARVKGRARKRVTADANDVARGNKVVSSFGATQGTWTVDSKHYVQETHGARVACATLHKASNILCVGLSTGVFGLYEMPTCTHVHTLSISSHNLDTVAINADSAWLAFGSRKLGQLLVWEWRSETYVLKQQGHFYDLNASAYSPDGTMIATGGDDGKVKMWNTVSGFCFVTFDKHAGAVTDLCFVRNGNAVLSASLDGTVRAFDLVRYRNFRTMTTPDPVQFMSLAVDGSGDVVCAGAMEPADIYVWSLQTGRLLDVLSGHEGPVSCLGFSPSAPVLASGSWDKTLRLWDPYKRSTPVETFHQEADVLALAWRPDGRELCCGNLKGQLLFWDARDTGKLLRTIEGRNDIKGGRFFGDRRTADNSAKGRCFTSVCYSADGECVLAGGRSKYACIYAVKPKLLIKKYQLSYNLSLSGVLDKLDSRNMTEAGPIDALDAGASDDEDMGRFHHLDDNDLPGARRGDLAKRRNRRPEIRCKCIRFSPTGHAWCCATTEGLLIYSLDGQLYFDPVDLDIDSTPQEVRRLVQNGRWTKALVMALHLREPGPLRGAYEAIPLREITTVARAVPGNLVQALMDHVADMLAKSPLLEFNLTWSRELLTHRGDIIRRDAVGFQRTLRALQQNVTTHRENFSRMVEFNRYTLGYLSSMYDARRRENPVAYDAAVVQNDKAAANYGAVMHANTVVTPEGRLRAKTPAEVAAEKDKADAGNDGGLAAVEGDGTVGGGEVAGGDEDGGAMVEGDEAAWGSWQGPGDD